MAAHTITLSAGEESLYQKWLALTGKTDADIMITMKNTLAAQVVQSINEAGRAKFESMSVAEKITFLG